MLGAVDLLKDHLWFADLHFIAFSAHGFDEYRKVKYTATVDIPFVLTVRGFNTQCKIFLELDVQTLTNVT